MCNCCKISAYFEPILLANSAHGVYSAAMAANALLSLAYDSDPSAGESARNPVWHARLRDALSTILDIHARDDARAAQCYVEDIEALEYALDATEYCRIFLDEGNIWLIHASQLFCDSCGLPYTGNPDEWCACDVPHVDLPHDVQTPQYDVEWDRIGHATIRYSWPHCADMGDENQEKSVYIQGDCARILAAKLAHAEMITHCECADHDDCESARLKYYEIADTILEDYMP